MAGGRLPDRAGSRALLVGVGTVREGGFDVLEYTDANLEALRDALCTGPDAVFAADRVRVLRSPERGEWYDELRRAAQETTDLLLFYFVGHGYRHALENVLYLLAPGADLDGDLGGTALRWSLIPDTVGKGKVRRAVFILDCCYSGMAADQHAGSGERGHYVLASVPRTRTQPSEPLPNGRSPFTDAIVTAMERGGAAEAGGLTLHELFGRLDEVMRDWPAPHVTDGWGPRNGSGGDGPDILLTRRVRTGADGDAGAGPGPGPGAGAVGGGGVPGEAPAGAAPPGPVVGGTAPTGAAVDGHPVTGTPVTGTAVAGTTPDEPVPGPAAGDPPAADPAVTAGGPPDPTGAAPGGSGDPSTTPARPAQDPPAPGRTSGVGPATGDGTATGHRPTTDGRAPAGPTGPGRPAEPIEPIEPTDPTESTPAESTGTEASGSGVSGAGPEPRRRWWPAAPRFGRRRSRRAAGRPGSARPPSPGRWWRRRPRTTAAIGAALVVLAGAGVFVLRDTGQVAACPPPLELRLLASTENRAAMSRAVAAYSASSANRQPLGEDDEAPGDCRRTNITVYEAPAGDIVEAFAAADAWPGTSPAAGTGGPCPAGAGPGGTGTPGPGTGPTGSGTDGGPGGPHCRETPLQDVGPQPDLVALGSSAELGRIQERVGRTGGPARVTALGPTGYSPLVLAVPAKLADAMREAGARRTGSTWPELLAALDEAAPDLPLLRPDPASSETGLLHTVGLYRAGHDGPWSGSADDDDAEHAERQVDDRHPLQRDADTLLCEQYTGDAGLPPPGEAAALVSEKAVADHNLGRRPHSSCDNNKPLDDSDRLLAYYPAGVPALDLPLAEVRWDGAPDAPDRTRRTAAVSRFHAWLTHGGSRHLLDGLVRGVDPGQRPAPPQGQAWADPDSGVLEDVEVVARPPGGPEADAAAAAYAETLRPGQVLFLVDNSGSLATGGKLGTVGRALSRALKTLGPEDRYGLWSYPGSADGPETPRVVVAPGTRGDDQAAARTWLAALSPDRVVPRGAAVYEVLDRAVAAMKGEDHPLIVLVTDGDDRPRGDPDRDDHLAWEQTRDEEGTPPVLVLSVRDAGCSEAVIQRLAFGGEDFCVSGRPEEAARQLAERISDHVQGGGTR